MLSIPDGDAPNFVEGDKISTKNLYEHFEECILTVFCYAIFSCIKSIFCGQNETSKNPLSELYYDLTLQVLSEEYTDYVAKFDATGDLTAEVNLAIQKAIR